MFEQIGKKLTQKSLSRAMPYIGAFIGATIDTAQMVQILKYADVFYNKRFLLEKEQRIKMLLGETTDMLPEQEVIEVENLVTE